MGCSYSPHYRVNRNTKYTFFQENTFEIKISFCISKSSLSNNILKNDFQKIMCVKMKILLTKTFKTPFYTILKSG